jgi:dihydropyrimidinase
MGFDTVIQGGTVVTATDSFVADVGIKGEKIAALGQDLVSMNGSKVIDAGGKYVLPGGIDVHVHLELPFCGTVSADDFTTGTKAAAAGGVTTVIDFANQDTEKGLMEGIRKRKELADPKVCVDYSFHSIITHWNENIEAEFPEVIDFGIPSFKMFMIYKKEGWQSDDAALFSALGTAREHEGMIMVHAESEGVLNVLIDKYLKEKDKWGAYAHTLSRPCFTESEAIQRAIKWSEVTGGHLYVVHMSTGEGADLVKAAKEKGVPVDCETCPQYLLLNDDVFKGPEGHLFATCPQIKKPHDSERLWKGLVDGEVPIVATDTCTFNKTQKAMWEGDFTRIPFGMPGVETLVPSVYTFGVREKKFSLNHLVSLISTHPAKLFGLYPDKGTIAVGADADLTVVDPDKSRTIDYETMETNCDWSPYQGMEMYGFPDVTLSRGTVVAEDGKFVGEVGHGRFVKRTRGGSL